VNTRKFHEIWIEQCDATYEIKLHYGVKAAFDYLVTEKLLNFADAAATHPDFARELPRFVACVRGLFTPEEIRTHLARIERSSVNTMPTTTTRTMSCTIRRESPAAAAERARQFTTIKELLTAAELGTL
jgi:hypothetical protein